MSLTLYTATINIFYLCMLIALNHPPPPHLWPCFYAYSSNYIRSQNFPRCILIVRVDVYMSEDSSRRALSNGPYYAIIDGSTWLHVSYASAKFLHINLIQRKIKLAVILLSRADFSIKYQVKPHFISYTAKFVIIMCMYLKQERRYGRFCERARRSVIANICTIVATELTIYNIYYDYKNIS